MKFFSRTPWLICVFSALCGACGQKGKLVMPVRPPTVSTPYPVALPKDDSNNMKSDATPPTMSKEPEPVSEVAPDTKPVEE